MSVVAGLAILVAAIVVLALPGLAQSRKRVALLCLILPGFCLAFGLHVILQGDPARFFMCMEPGDCDENGVPRSRDVVMLYTLFASLPVLAYLVHLAIANLAFALRKRRAQKMSGTE